MSDPASDRTTVGSTVEEATSPARRRDTRSVVQVGRIGTSPYFLGEPLAKGGMAEVFLGLKVSDLGPPMPVVIKRILPHLVSDGQFVQMFLDEGRLAGRLRHPNIVRILDMCREDENFFVVMEYLRGESLLKIAARHSRGEIALPPAIALYIVERLADALHVAHEANVVHRDATPSNAIVTYDGVPKLIDFGIAKAGHQLSYTMPGTLKGKHSYSSPEQARGRTVDRRSDVFTLGIVMFELLTGKRLFKRRSPADTLQAIMSAPIPPIDIEGVPPDIDRVLAAALERNVEARLQTAAELRQEVARVREVLNPGLDSSYLARWMHSTFADELAQRKVMEQVAREAALSGKPSRAPQAQPRTRRARPKRRNDTTRMMGIIVLIIVLAAGAFVLGRLLR